MSNADAILARLRGPTAGPVAVTDPVQTGAPTTSNDELLRSIYGWGALPTESSGEGQYGAYTKQGLTADQIGGLVNDASKGFVPLQGTSGGYAVTAMADPNAGNEFHIAGPNDKGTTYQLEYTPNYSGSRTAMNQDIAQEDKGSAIVQGIGMMMVGGGFSSALTSTGMNAMTAGAISGGTMGAANAALQGGDIGKGALLGAAGGAWGGYAQGIGGTTAGISNKLLANLGGKAVLGAAAGKDSGQILADVVGSAAGAAAGNYTGNNLAAGLASSLTSRFIAGALSDGGSTPAPAQPTTNTNTPTPQNTSLPKVPGLVAMMRR